MSNQGFIFKREAKVSVIVPTFNRSHLVCDAIDSALTQTLPPHEIIVVDDGSTDDTALILKKYGDRIHYIYQPNCGVSAARNIGISLSTGDHIAFLDSDDLWLPNKLETQVAILEKLQHVDVLFTEFGILRQDGTVTHGGTRRWFPHNLQYVDLYDSVQCLKDLGVDIEGVDSNSEVYFGKVFDRMLHLPYGLLSSSIIRRNVIENSLKFTEGVSLYEDWEFFAKIAKSRDIGFVNLELTFNRSHRGPERLTLSPNIKKTLSYLGVLDRVWKADPQFMSSNALMLKIKEADALLVLARDCILERDKKTASEALQRWHSLQTTRYSIDAWIYGVCLSILYGPILLKFLLRLRTFFRIVTGSAKKGKYSCAPN